MEESNFSIEFREQVWMQIIEVLKTAPYNIAEPIIQSIVQQTQMQVNLRQEQRMRQEAEAQRVVDEMIKEKNENKKETVLHIGQPKEEKKDGKKKN
jgi:hypothetical protein